MCSSELRNVIARALYHPPRPLYDSSSLIDYIEGCTDEITRTFPQKLIVLAGDFNQLSTKSILERTGLISLVSQPTRGTSILDQILVSQPEYQKVQVLTSVVRSDE